MQASRKVMKKETAVVVLTKDMEVRCRIGKFWEQRSDIKCTRKGRQQKHLNDADETKENEKKQ